MIKKWVMVGGCPRSGTTMLGNFLGAAPTAIVTPEAQFASEALEAVEMGHVAATPEGVQNFISEHWRFSAVWEMDFPDSFLKDIHESDPIKLVSQALRHIVSAYARKHGKPDAEIWIDHTPGHLSRLPRIEKTDFEHAAVHLVRDGRAIAASLAKVDWGPTNARHAAEWWTLKVAEALAAQRVSRSTTALMRYEDLMSSPERSLETLCAELGIPYGPEMIQSKALAVPKYTLSQHTHVGRGVQAARSEAWRQELSERDQEVFEAMAGTLLQIFEYPRLYDSPKKASYFERAWHDLFLHPIYRRLQGRRNLMRRSEALRKVVAQDATQ